MPLQRITGHNLNKLEVPSSNGKYSANAEALLYEIWQTIKNATFGASPGSGLAVDVDGKIKLGASASNLATDPDLHTARLSTDRFVGLGAGDSGVGSTSQRLKLLFGSENNVMTFGWPTGGTDENTYMIQTVNSGFQYGIIDGVANHNQEFNLLRGKNSSIGVSAYTGVKFINSADEIARFAQGSIGHSVVCFQRAAFLHGTNNVCLRADAGAIKFFVGVTTQGTEAMRIHNDTLIGIGTGQTAPGAKVDILQGSGTQLRLLYSSTRHFGIAVSSTGSTAFTLTGTGTPVFTFNRGITCSAGNIEATAGTIKTNNPGNGAQPWLLGSIVAGAVAMDAANYVEVSINGTVVKLLKAS